MFTQFFSGIYIYINSYFTFLTGRTNWLNRSNERRLQGKAGMKSLLHKCSQAAVGFSKKGSHVLRLHPLFHSPEKVAENTSRNSNLRYIH